MQPLSLSNRSWLTVHVSKPYSNAGSTVALKSLRRCSRERERERGGGGGGDFQMLAGFLN